MIKEKEKKELTVLIIGAAVLIGLLIFRGTSSRRPAGNVLPAATATPVAQTAETPGSTQPGAGHAQLAPPAPREINYTGRQHRDPLDNLFLIPKAPEEPAETPVAVKKTVELFPVNEFKVSAIIWGSGKPQAIINDSVMSVGESIMDGKIVGIDKNGVHVSYEGEEVLLSIK